MALQLDRINGLIGDLGIKAPVRAATTANIMLSGLQTVDGVSLAAGDRVLVKNQTAGADNGIYAASVTTWLREPDFDGSRDVVTGTVVFVTAGAQASLWGVTTTGSITIGTTSLAFALWGTSSYVGKTSTTGSAVLPAGTTAQRDSTPAAGYTRFNSSYAKPEVYNGSAWAGLGGAAGAGGDDIFYENGQTVTADYTITSGKNALTAGPVTIASGITVTIPSGSVWTIV